MSPGDYEEIFREDVPNNLPEGVWAQVTVRDSGDIEVAVVGDDPAFQAHLLGHIRDVCG